MDFSRAATRPRPRNKPHVDGRRRGIAPRRRRRLHRRTGADRDIGPGIGPDLRDPVTFRRSERAGAPDVTLWRVSFADWRRRRPVVWAGRLALVLVLALAAMTLALAVTPKAAVSVFGQGVKVGAVAAQPRSRPVRAGRGRPLRRGHRRDRPALRRADPAAHRLAAVQPQRRRGRVHPVRLRRWPRARSRPARPRSAGSSPPAGPGTSAGSCAAAGLLGGGALPGHGRRGRADRPGPPAADPRAAPGLLGRDRGRVGARDARLHGADRADRGRTSSARSRPSPTSSARPTWPRSRTRSGRSGPTSTRSSSATPPPPASATRRCRSRRSRTRPASAPPTRTRSRSSPSAA